MTDLEETKIKETLETKESIGLNGENDTLLVLDIINDEDNIVQYDNNIVFHLGDLEKRRIKLCDNTTEIIWLQKDDKKSIRKVFISIKVKQVSDIDNVLQQYRMRFHIYFNWIMNENDYQTYYQHNINNNVVEKEWTPKWYPKLEFLNAIEQHVTEWSNYPQHGNFKVQTFKDFAQNNHLNINNKFDPNHMKFIRAKLECDITFAQELELQSFPFDCQDLACLIRENANINCKFLPELRKRNFASIDTSVSIIDEWDIESALIEFGLSDVNRSRTKSKYCRIALRLKMKRKYFAILFNIIIPMAFICGLSLTTFSLHAVDELGERLNLLITLILTLIAFQYVISEKLPNLAYLTFIDKYVLISYLFLTVITIENAFGRVIGNEYDKNVFFKLCIAVFICYHTSFAFYAIYLRNSVELKKLSYDSAQVEREVNFKKEILKFDYTKCVYQPNPANGIEYLFSVTSKLANNNKTFFNLF